MIFVKVVVIRLFVRIHHGGETDFFFVTTCFSGQSPICYIFVTFVSPEYVFCLFFISLGTWDCYQHSKLSSQSATGLTTLVEKLATPESSDIPSKEK